MKKFNSISWNIDEETYRADSALSYSVLAKYEREGFSSLNKLFDKIETPSLTLGSAVDSIITGGKEEFKEKFMVADFPSISDSLVKIVTALFNKYGKLELASRLADIPDSEIIEATSVYSYQLNWKPETRAKVIKEKGKEYFNLLFLAGNKTILNTTTYNTVVSMVDALKTKPATKWYFQEDNPFDNIERNYQLKFKANLNGIDYKFMADLLIVDYNNKIIYPVDLKTSYKHEYEFYKSFIEWRYDIQSKLYYRIIRYNLDKDDYFKDFKLDDYRFIVVSRDCNPLVWVYPSTKSIVSINTGRYNQILLRDPEIIGKELKDYLSSNPIVPNGINLVGVNNLNNWLVTI